MDYSALSKELTNKLTKEEKKNNGIYFTPPSCIHNNLNLLEPYMKTVKNVLEPSCGSCEYINALRKRFPHLNITGIELNKIIFESIQNNQNNQDNEDNQKNKFYNEDFLLFKTDTKYDLIIGNPPYFVIKKSDVNKKYYKYFDGRPNIFILFIIRSLELLNDNGILSFVLPKNFLNCLYYDNTRKYINEHFQILEIKECIESFMDTEQETIIMIIKKIESKKVKEVDNNEYVLYINNYTIFTEKTNKTILNNLYKSSTTLNKLGFKVSVGTVVWNQCKDILTDDSTKTRLVYSSDIVDNKLVKKKFTNEKKKNYINKPGFIKPIIVINRGYGVGEYKFNYCLIDEKTEILIENHLICIEPNCEMKYDEIITQYKKILASLEDERTNDFVNTYFGNNAINTTELNYILPIYEL